METYKVVVLGVGGVGKSALTIQLVQGRFVPSYDPTIEDSYKKTIVVDGVDVTLDILDTAGQDDFAAIRSTYMRSGQGFIVVFAVNDPTSFDSIERFQKDIRITSGKEDIPIVVCGNKCDIEERSITKEEANQLCQSFKIKYFETSAKTNYNVSEVFAEITRMMREQNPSVNTSTDKGKKEEKKEEKQEKKGCCNLL
ncbi:GTPase KRas isoform X2 [Histomonas meleagridis]|uniref:GTPase KRas isoform X2 n=1 Tax=Histomonas meleagridis TaxID=135588 RepID=UPI00355A3884|nr:GTPase KRas isoform X2 [Histomonas meleagridis]KAH0803211.1 GTPase KRas isoform X2 [Histomonas meleagridis]